MKNVSAKTVFSYILHVVRPFWGSIGVMILVALVWSIDVSLAPYLLKIILNQVADASKPDLWGTVGGVILLYLTLSFTMSTVWRLYDYFVNIKMIPKMRRNIATTAVQKLLGQSHQFYQANFTGSLVNKVNDLVNSVPDILQIITDRFLALFLVILISVFSLWHVGTAFALCMLAWAGVFVIGSLLLSGRMNKLSDDWSECGSLITGKMVDALSNILSIRLFARKRDEVRILDEAFSNAVKAEKKMQWMNFWVWFVYGYSFFLTQILNFYFLIKGHQEGWITVGDFVIVTMINISIVEFMWQVTREFPHFTRLFGKITQALRAILAEASIQDTKDAHTLVVDKGEIQFEAVTFGYYKANPLFYNQSVRIKAGEKVGLVGYSGSGKTSFVNLVLRLYDVHSGRILIDGQDIAQASQDSLHEAISMIPQDPSLFYRSLMENIRYGKLDASDEEVVEAAKRARAHDFIMAMPQGYDSLVGERGVKLSGGQRQRLAIARAILKNAPILILDEATSQLDSVTENEIQDSIQKLMHDKTTLVIAHRLSTLLHMDRILVFDRGKIVESGSHQELLASGKLYKTLWEKQVGGFLPDKA